MAPAVKDKLLLAALVAIHLVPIWTLTYLPSQDGPAHLAVANILREYGEPDGQAFRQYFVLESGAITNWFVYLLLAYGLGFLPLALAEKVFLSAYVILFSASALYAVRAVEPRNGFLALLAVPFTFNYLLGMGFYNFCFSLVAFFFALGYWLRHRDRLSWLRGSVLALLVLWVYLCHVVSVGTLLAAIGTLALWESRSVRRWLPTALALVPTLVLMLVFVNEMDTKTASIPLAEKLGRLARLEALASYDPRTRYVAWTAAALFGGLAVWALLRARREWLAVFLVFVALLLVMPTNVGVGGFLDQRLMLFPFFAVILWLAASEPPAWLRRGIRIAAVGLSLTLLGLLWNRWRVIDGYLAEYLSVEEQLPEGSTLLSLSYSHFGTAKDGSELSYRVQPFVHAVSHVTAAKPVVDLRLYSATYEKTFPLHYRPELNPYHHISQGYWSERIPPWVDFLTYPKRTGGRVDYVLIWQLPAEWRNPAVRSVRRQLRTRYERVWTSPRGHAVLYRWRAERTRGARSLPTVR